MDVLVLILLMNQRTFPSLQVKERAVVAVEVPGWKLEYGHAV